MSVLPKQIAEIVDKTREPQLPIDHSLQLLGTLIDTSYELREIEGLREALRFGSTLEKQDGWSSDRKLGLFYYISNAWGDIYEFTKANRDESWGWEQPEVEKQIVYLRKAIIEPAFSTTHEVNRCQILTNLGNTLNHVGRSVEALQCWRDALALKDDFGMALGNFGKGLTDYGRSLHKRHDAIIVYNKGIEYMTDALDLPDLHPGAVESFIDHLKGLEPLTAHVRIGNHSFEKHEKFGRSKKEIAYRNWAVGNTLFLNHLNDLGVPSPEAAFDNLTLPSMVRPLLERSSHFEGLINQLKQEFVSARFLYFEAITSTNVHFSDRKVSLYNTLDCPSYSLAVEKVKIAFRLAYSILDKIAYFLNEYLDLKIPLKSVTFRTFWYKNLEKKKGLRSEFLDRRNWSLRGLFWLSKDLYENEPMFRAALEPDAQELAEIRNHLEHKYLKVHEFGALEPELREDSLAYSIGRSEMVEKTLNMLKMARSALVYLILAIHTEELARERARDGNTKAAEIFIDTFDDSWKL